MADEVERLRTTLTEMRGIVDNLQLGISRSAIVRALDSVSENLYKYERSLKEPTMEQLPHPTPTCILHGKPITWEDPECEICKALKEGNYDGKTGANDNYRHIPGRGGNS
jgi:hypothetical protein